MTPLRERMIQDMRLRNFSPRTIEVYIYHVACFAKFRGRSPELLGPEDVRAFQVHMVEVRQVSWSSFNQAVCALRFLYGQTLRRDWPVVMIPFAKRPKKLPVVLGPEEVLKLLACAPSPMMRMIFTTLYAGGLRLEECLHLTISDIDSARMLLRVAQGKGRKERQVPLSPRLLTELREHYLQFKPRQWLFPATKSDQPINPASVQKACQMASRRAGFTKRVTPHVLRHSYATGLMEAGVDLLTIQRLMGHSSLSSTLIYLHVRRQHLESITSPLDLLPVEQLPRITPPDSTPLA